MDREKIANNILELMLDPTRVPVRQRLYFRPEEILDNEVYERAKLQGLQAYHGQRFNSDFYPIRNRSQTQREVSVMDRRTLIASLDILSQQFKEDGPFATDLRTMAYAVSEMDDTELQSKLAELSVEAKKKVEMVTCPQCGGKVMKKTNYCLTCKKSLDDMKGDKGKKEKAKGKKEKAKGKKADDQTDEFWSEAAAKAVLAATVSDVTGAEWTPEEKAEKESVQKMVEIPGLPKINHLMQTMKQKGLIEKDMDLDPGELVSAVFEMVTNDNSMMKRIVNFISKGVKQAPAMAPAKSAQEEPVTEVDQGEAVEVTEQVPAEGVKKKAGPVNGPGIPDGSANGGRKQDGTGPYGGTPACPMTKKEDKSAEVDTDILAAEEEVLGGNTVIDGIEFSASGSIDKVDMSDDEAARLAGVFGFDPGMTPEEKEKYDQLLGK